MDGELVWQSDERNAYLRIDNLTLHDNGRRVAAFDASERCLAVKYSRDEMLRWVFARKGQVAP